jgi:DNA polymerase II small subunit
MDSREILEFCLQKGLLLDKEVLGLFSETQDIESVKLIIEKIRSHTQKRIITRNLFDQNKEQVSQVFLTLPEESQRELKTLKIKLGLSIEISKEIEKPREIDFLPFDRTVKILSTLPPPSKKLETKDFVNYFKSRFNEMKGFLQDSPKLTNLVSINKIIGNKQGMSIIGLVSDKRVTKNKNILLEVEDLTGKIRVLINQNKPEIYEKGREIALDSVLGFTGSGNGEIFFANDVLFPDSYLPERRNSPVEEYALFIGDLHFGSKLFLKESFLKFIDYVNGNLPGTPEVKKIKYIFFVGDLIAGVGNYPSQERDLEIKDIEEQFIGLADLIKKIRKDVKIIISPGNHDGVRLMEPQPLLAEKYAWALYDLENLIFTTNPSLVNIGAVNDFGGFNVLVYHGFSFFHYADNVFSLMKEKAAHKPELIMKYLLKNRHLAPTHASVQYFPSELDVHVIRKIPDIFLVGHTHKSAVTYYNNILLISVSSWESMTDYMEKRGSKPDFCKVPMFNLKTRQVKILDFEKNEHSEVL